MNINPRIRNGVRAVRSATSRLFRGLIFRAVLLPTCLYAVVAWQDHASVWEQAIRTITSSVEISESNIRHVFQTHELVANLVNEHIQGMSWQEISDSEALHNYLAEIVRALPQALSLWLIDPLGILRNSSANYPGSSVSVADRDYFKALSKNDTGLIIGRRVKDSLFRDQDLFSVARRRQSSSGAFNGVVAISVSPSYFTTFWDRANDYAGATSIVFRSDGVVLARRPAVDRDAPLDADGLLMRAIATADAGHVRGISTVDGVDRFSAYRKVVGFPLYVAEGINVSSVLQMWYGHLVFYGVFFALATLALASAAFVVERRAREIAGLNVILDQRASALAVANRELGAFAYSASHVLRAPLRAIDGYSHILLEEHSLGLDREGIRLVEALRSNASALNKQIDGILEFLRLGRDKLTPGTIDMAEIVEMTLKELEPMTSGRDIKFKVSHLPRAFGDAAMIRHVWASLIDNAVKFTGRKADALIEVGALSNENETVYFVRDNGVGFDMRFADKLFGVFNRLHGADFPGNGAGLAIVQRIVSRNGGRVWAESRLDEGATFYFTLPASEMGHE